MEKELKVVINLEDNVSNKMPNITGSIIKAELALEALKVSAGLVYNALEKAFSFGKDALNTAVAYEQNSIAFKSMIGNAEEAKTLLKDISKFARQTPFELPEVQEGAKRLLAYNVAAQDIIPTFQMLGDIASGVGKDKLPQLILAFGQVKAATKLTGAELRQFSEAGVPLLQALIDQANKSGGALVKMGGMSKEASSKIKSLSASTAQASFDLKYFEQNGGATEKQMEKLRAKIEKNEAQIKSFGNVGTEYYTRVKVTAAQMIDKISDGEVTFDQVKTALQGMTEEGGKFNNLMAVQAASLGGIWSNLSDSVTRLHLSFMGLSEDGEIINQGLFDKIKEGSQAMQGAMEGLNLVISEKIAPAIVGFISKIEEISNKIYEKVKPSLEDLGLAIKEDLIPTLKSMNIDWATLERILVEQVSTAIIVVVEVLKEVIKFIKENKTAIETVLNAYVSYINTLNTVFSVASKVVGVLKDLNDLIQGKNVDKLLGKYGSKALNFVIDQVKPRAHGGFVPGSAYDAFPTVLHGGERVIPRNGTDVNKGNTSNITVNFNGNIGQATQNDLDAIIQAVKSAINRENLLYSQGAY